MSHQQKAPSHGTKVTDPSSTHPEPSGPVPKESLASESLRSGGSFAANTSVSGSDLPQTTGENVRTFQGKKPESPLGEPDEVVKSKAGLTGTAGGGKQRHQAFSSSGGREEAEKEDVDWSKIPKEMRDTTDIGSEDDPGRVGEKHMEKKAMQRGGAVGPEGDYDNPYTSLKPDETI